MKIKIGNRIAALMLVGVIGSSLAGCGTNNNLVEKELSLLPEKAIKLEASVEDVYGNAKAIVTIISDDGFYDSCINLDRVLGERNLRCTVAGIIRIVAPHMADWNELLQHGTIDLVSHSFNHIKMEEGTEIAQDVVALYHEIVDADQWYENWLGTEQIVFVCPENQMCEIGYNILEDNDFWSVRKGNRGYNSISPEEGVEVGQWLNLKVQGICDEGVDTQVRNSWVDTAINDRTWLIEMWHNVMPEYDGRYQTILVSDAEEHLDYVAQKVAMNDIWVATYDEAVKYIRERQNSSLSTYIINDKLYVSLELTNSDMSYKTFNQPLTVSISLPEGYSVSETEKVDLNNNILSINIVPGDQTIIPLLPSVN